MKELRLLEGWADEVINEFKRDRDDVLPIEQDPIRQVQRKYPQLSDTEAASKFIHDITKDFVDQTAIIDAQRKENERLKKSVADISREIGQIEQDGENTQRELDRLRQLSGQIRGEVQGKRVSQGEIDEILNQAREGLKGKTGISDEQYQEVVKKINDMKDGIVDPKKFQEVKASVEALAGQTKIDPREFEKLRGEIQRATADRDEISRMMTQFQELKNKPGLDPKQYDALKSELESKIAGLQAGRIEPAAFDALKKQLDVLDGETKVKSVDIDRVQKLLDKIEARQYDTKQKEMSVDAKFAELERQQQELKRREQKIEKENQDLKKKDAEKEARFQAYKAKLVDLLGPNDERLESLKNSVEQIIRHKNKNEEQDKRISNQENVNKIQQSLITQLMNTEVDDLISLKDIEQVKQNNKYRFAENREDNDRLNYKKNKLNLPSNSKRNKDFTSIYYTTSLNNRELDIERDLALVTKKIENLSKLNFSNGVKKTESQINNDKKKIMIIIENFANGIRYYYDYEFNPYSLGAVHTRGARYRNYDDLEKIGLHLNEIIKPYILYWSKISGIPTKDISQSISIHLREMFKFLSERFEYLRRLKKHMIEKNGWDPDTYFKNPEFYKEMLKYERLGNSFYLTNRFQDSKISKLFRGQDIEIKEMFQHDLNKIIDNILGPQYQKYLTPTSRRTLTEGGNIFKAPGWSRENPQMLTSRITRDQVPHTLDYLETITGIELADNLLGSTGIAPTSGDIDIAVDASKHPKDRLEAHLLEAGVDPEHLVKTGESLHYMCPIFDEDGHIGRFVQVDFMFVPDVQFARWSMRTAPDSQYKGVYLQKLRADLTNTVAPKDPSGKSQWKWNHFKGVLNRSDDSSVFGFDPDKIAKGLLGPRAGKDDLESVERILGALKDSQIRKDVVNTYRQTLARDQAGKQLPPDDELDK